MPKEDYGYKDEEKFKAARRRQNQRYYEKTSFANNSKSKWSEHEIELIMNSDLPDSHLSEVLGRSVKAIQCKRNRLKSEGGF